MIDDDLTWKLIEINDNPGTYMGLYVKGKNDN